MVRRKNDTLEIFKLIASYMVVFIHIRFYGNVGVIADALARFAVPFFFLISGFYSFGCTTEKIKKRIKHILSLIFLAILAYTFYDVVLMLFQDNYTGIISYFKVYLMPEKWHSLLVYNLPIYKTHLWYLFAILYVYIIYYFVLRFKFSQTAFLIISILLLAVHLFLGEVLLAFKTFIPIIYVRNFALMGIPFFAIGLICNKYQEKLASMPNIITLAFLTVGVTATLLSRLNIGKNELYIGSLFILFAVVTFSIKYSYKQYPKTIVKIAGCNTYIYIFHIMIISATQVICSILKINIYTKTGQMIMPLVICAFSTVFALILNEITRFFKCKQLKINK